MSKDFIHIFVLSCERATCLAEKQLHVKLRLIDRLQLKIHLSLCALCRFNDAKFRILHKIMIAKIEKIVNQKGNFHSQDIDNLKSEIKKKLC